jgi:hypothetical protein
MQCAASMVAPLHSMHMPCWPSDSSQLKQTGLSTTPGFQLEPLSESDKVPRLRLSTIKV